MRYLDPRAFKSAESGGRRHPERECRLRTVFQRDRDRIIHSKAFRRLKHKTQVFIAPEGDHYRTRLTHTLEVAQIARTVCRGLGLNEDLAEAIALGHDLGHTPFGHTGEKVLDDIHPRGFRHNQQSLRVVDLLEVKSERYRGLNLSREVREGIRCHSGEERPSTLEGQVVRIADRVAYINHDIDDALRAGILKPRSLPSRAREVLGDTHGERIDAMVSDLIRSSRGEDEIQMSPATAGATDRLRDFLFREVYIGSAAKREEEKAERLLGQLYRYYCRHEGEILETSSLPPEEGTEPGRLACDYVAGMTDRFAIKKFEELFVPHPW